MVDTACAWVWSSDRATAGLVNPPNWLDVHWTLAQFDPWDQVEAHRLYRQFVAAGAGITRSPWEDLRCGLYLGSIEFGEKLRALVGTRSSGKFKESGANSRRDTLLPRTCDNSRSC